MSEAENIYLDVLARLLDETTIVSVLGVPPWVPPDQTGSVVHRFEDEPPELPRSDVILCAANRSRPELLERLHLGGTLVAFGPDGAALSGAAQLDSLHITRRDPPRQAFERGR